jgi:hypothetical protein
LQIIVIRKPVPYKKHGLCGFFVMGYDAFDTVQPAGMPDAESICQVFICEDFMKVPSEATSINQSFVQLSALMSFARH